MKDIHFDGKGMTNDCPLVADRSFGDCVNCRHFVVFNSNFKIICNFPGVRGKPRTWFYKVNKWVDEDSVTYKVLEMTLLPGDIPRMVVSKSNAQTFWCRYVEDAITKGKDLAKQHHCKFLDINCPRGSGGRKVIILK